MNVYSKQKVMIIPLSRWLCPKLVFSFKTQDCLLFISSKSYKRYVVLTQTSLPSTEKVFILPRRARTDFKNENFTARKTVSPPHDGKVVKESLSYFQIWQLNDHGVDTIIWMTTMLKKNNNRLLLKKIRRRRDNGLFSSFENVQVNIRLLFSLVSS